MTARPLNPRASHDTRESLLVQDPRTKARNATEKRFRAYGLTAIVVALLALVWLLISIFGNGLPAFKQTFITLPVTLDDFDHLECIQIKPVMLGRGHVVYPGNRHQFFDPFESVSQLFGRSPFFKGFADHEERVVSIAAKG